MKINAVLFDLDGTLLDTTPGVIESARYAARQLGLKELPYNTMLKFVGPPIQNSFMEYYGCSQNVAQKAADFFRTYYKSEALLKAMPYEWIFELCDKLVNDGIKLAVATYKREDYALTLLKHFGFDRFCVSMHGADNLNVLTKADIVKLCIQETGEVEENSVLIGDTIYDAVGAEKAGINFIAVTYGFGFKNKEDLHHPNIGVANDTKEIYEIITKLRNI